eukprot:GHRQ01018745.1.p1 GENE.GHRQ01018745.1~~GHRQ01018745.1.p1  ORF type:complete len:187 (+),score=6.27 GHRQ01018745.1:1341-1901(+)
MSFNALLLLLLLSMRPTATLDFIRSGAAQGFLLCYTSSVLGCGLCSSCHVLRAARLLTRAMVQLVHQHRVCMTLSKCCQGPVLCYLLVLCLLSAALIVIAMQWIWHCSIALLSAMHRPLDAVNDQLCRRTHYWHTMYASCSSCVCLLQQACKLAAVAATLGVCTPSWCVLFTIKPLARAAAAEWAG